MVFRHVARVVVEISIHAPREGRDPCQGISGWSRCYFNPRAPRGARLPHRGKVIVHIVISIHAPREGRDAEKTYQGVETLLFQSTRPARGATSGPKKEPLEVSRFQSTRPARGATGNDAAGL